MYLSCLLIDTGDNPDRPRPGRLWLRNFYHVHQRLCMAFPSMARKSGDADFLKAFAPEDFAEQVHVERWKESGFLFRADPKPGGRVMVLVQSAVTPDWGYAFHNANRFLAATPEVKPYNPCFTQGQYLRFALCANPVKRLNKERNRVPLIDDDELTGWLSRKLDGAANLEETSVVGKNTLYFRKGATRGKIATVTFSGTLKVTDTAKLANLVEKGIGSAKAFGCGLLSLARA